MNKKLRNNGWLKLKNYINDTYEIGDNILRQTLIRNIRGIPTSTIDGYRNRLQQVGILERAGRGKYRLLQKIPENMNTVVLWDLIMEQARMPHVCWFIPLQDRVDRMLSK